MTNKITCFVPSGELQDLQSTLNELAQVAMVKEIFITGKNIPSGLQLPAKAKASDIESLQSTQGIKKLALLSTTPYVLIYTKTLPLKLGAYALERMYQVAEDTGAGMVYADHYEKKQGKLSPLPVIDYQEGSLRDDFNFGSVMIYNAAALSNAAAQMSENYKFAALYDLRLKVSQQDRLVRIAEYLYTEMETDTRKSGEKMFDYVDPKNREVQIEMEQACTRHLKHIGAWLKPEFAAVDFGNKQFPVEASVIIPVRNRIKTVEDAVRSVFSQQTSFNFNLIIVDNHSTDGTTELLRRLAAEDKRLILVIPQRDDLGIGGCWNEAIYHEQCGKFAIQLDSDDLYIDNNVVQKIVDAFYAQNCAMVVGSYQMVNFKLEEIPPGLIDHKEWTPDNGRNNALRINGLGAPRAFFTPVIRNIRVPNVSYGEDYALGLAISRTYQIGRIYEPLYLCRRWDDNTDASLDVTKMNAHNLYKDKIRTVELLARLKSVKSQ
jgi:hypothetical protein